ncbi:SDR family NAD(P)-dependent oxidoreductase [Rhodococcus sp. NPDC127530]|uniref:SDR family NAD(P)-dependent oxidoreductase n=1 Tax=unclassified Rhodococcus (in: high G+C Gram-positive bacteria) TaxID=192944 RepID=UPI00363D729A
MSSEQGTRPGRLTGKVVLVTGAGNGIGRAVAELAYSEGAQVALLDYDGEAALAAVEAIGGDHDLMSIQADISNPPDIDSAVTAVLETFGRVDVLFNVAGVFDMMTPTEELTVERWNKVFDVNVRGTMLLTQRVLREMLPRGSGAIVNTASTASLIAGGGGTAYIASKGAIASMTRQVAWEVAERGVRVNAVAPGATETNFPNRAAAILGSDEQGPAAARMLARAMESATHGAIPMGRLGSPMEMAKAAVFLGSDDASYITGALLVVDGGLTIQ